MSDTYSIPQPGTSSGQLPNTDPGVDRPSVSMSVGYCPQCFYLDTTGGNLTCHRNAPLPQAGAINWPAVKVTDWCGEFRNKQQ